MDKEDIKITDIKRILIGDSPLGFMLEVMGRTLLIYLLLMVVMRLLGKRMNAQFSILDLAVMLTLGAIASVPMQAFDRGLLPGIVLLFSILLLHQGSNILTYKNSKVEKFTEGDVSELIKDGVVNTARLKKMRISKDQLFSILRNKGVGQLGEVKRLYSETDGNFSLFKFDKPKLGLSVFPVYEDALPPSKHYVEHKDILACANCGNLIKGEKSVEVECSNCGNKDWVQAIQ